MQESIILTILPIIGLAIFWMTVAGGIIVMYRANSNSQTTNIAKENPLKDLSSHSFK
jgi:hypothetical protein